jgi:hypothetical protein
MPHRSFKVLCTLSLALFATTSAHAQTPNARQARIEAQIDILNQEKAARTPAQRKIASSLLYALKQRRDVTLRNALPRLRSATPDANNRVLVEVRGRVSGVLTSRVRAAGGVVGSSTTNPNNPRGSVLRARLPLEQLEAIAAQPDVTFIREPSKPRRRDVRTSAMKVVGRQAVQKSVAPALSTAVRAMSATPRANTGFTVSEGVATHQAEAAHNEFNTRGAGVKIGVISDSVDYLEDSQMSEDLPQVTVLPGQVGSGVGEGTAMLEIIHDMAPEAELFFATHGPTQEQFAANVRALRRAGCDIIVDDIFFPDEAAFQYGPISQAIRDVTRDGALYFSAAGNNGNLSDGTSGTWEGGFRASTPSTTPKKGTLHNWGRGVENGFKSFFYDGTELTLQWNDLLGASKNDYDLYLLDGSGQIIGASTTSQTGTQDPFEEVYSLNVGTSVLVARYSGEAKYLRLVSYTAPLRYATAGSVADHNGIPECVSVAAVSARTSFPSPFTGGARNPVEEFSSDGPRRLFFDASGVPSGKVVQKPDLAAADDVRTSLPGFGRFLGTSAAAPHAAAMAALIKSYNPSLTNSDIRNLMQRTALDIEQPGIDRDSGYGIAMVVRALNALRSEDQFGPVVTIRTPAYNVGLSRLSSISGTVKDTSSGIARVELYIVRERDNNYWTGRNWSSLPLFRLINLTGDNFNVTDDLPNDLSLLAGNYNIYVAATDQAGNRTVSTTKFRVLDTTAPQLTLDYIDRDAANSRIVRLRGRIIDEARGSGPDRVQVYLRRARDGRYWSGTAWTSTSTPLSTVLSGNTFSQAWVRDAGLPTDAPLNASEVFYLTVIGYDVMGNRSVATKSVTLQGKPATTAT